MSQSYLSRLGRACARITLWPSGLKISGLKILEAVRGKIAAVFTVLGRGHSRGVKVRWFKFGAWIVGTLVLLQWLVVPGFSQSPVKIQVMMQALEANQWQEMEAAFEEANPDIDLELVEAPNATNLVEDLYTSAFLLGDSPYDLVYLDIVWVPKFAAAGWLMDLSDRLSPEDEADFLDGDLAGGRYQEGLYRIPFRSDGGMLYYRTDLLAQAGYDPPRTFDDLIQISQSVQEQGLAQWGYLWQGQQYEGLAAMFVEILRGHGAFWVDPDSLEVGLDQPNAIAAVEFLRSTIEKGISPPGVTTYAEEETRRLFQNGNTLFLRNWPYVAGLAADSPIADQFAIQPMVHLPGEESGACQGGWGLGISATTPHPDEAWRVIEFITSREVQKQFILDTRYVPSRRSLFNDPDIVAAYDYYPQLLEVVENSVLRPPIAQYAQASDILQRYLSAAITGRMTPEAAMQAAARETRNVLGRA
ncbi:ABC transporter substrate-binding protein [Spirulina subsalsa FACHB-351]|uniref:ABC transporter substrate-binding protein n=1 Tax=Spirulina subsalsa FACHB-351 TaxID=234711 RepID=A0ABT3L9L0_9CYAN|nr:ABC transporter substrate-binding protein [Spirulina subsalsa]MCW6038198.1 ABC transporter substrate-binding protein [Spirulina subsalsa FACHB-351]